MRARLNGTFRVFSDDGHDITPVGMKERGLIALLLAVLTLLRPGLIAARLLA